MLKTLGLVLLIGGIAAFAVLALIPYLVKDIYYRTMWPGPMLIAYYINNTIAAVVPEAANLGKIEVPEGFVYLAYGELWIDYYSVYPRPNCTIINATLYLLKTSDLNKITAVYSGELTEKDFYKFVELLELKKISKQIFLNKTYELLKRPNPLRGVQLYRTKALRLESGDLTLVAVVFLKLKHQANLSKHLYVRILSLGHFKVVLTYNIKPTLNQYLRALDLAAIGVVLLVLDAYRNPEEYKTLREFFTKLKGYSRAAIPHIKEEKTAQKRS